MIRSRLQQMLLELPNLVTLSEKIAWLDRLLEWIRPSIFSVKNNELYGTSEKIIDLLDELDQNVETKLQVSLVIREVLSRTSGIKLFSRTGLSREQGFMSESIDRILNRFLPQPFDDRELGDLCARFFNHPLDYLWIKKASPRTLRRIFELIQFAQDKKTIHGFEKDILDSLIILSAQISSIGLSQEIRDRLPGVRVDDNAFLKLYFLCYEFKNARISQNHEHAAVLQDLILKQVDLCRLSIEDVIKHLEEFGVSVSIVFNLEKLSQNLNRIDQLLALLGIDLSQENSQKYLFDFVFQVIEEVQGRRSLKGLVRNNLHLISRKIVERAGHSGEHYIARDRKEYRDMFWAGAGGGILTVFTTLFKFSIAKAKFALFFEAFFNTLNYAGSFVLMQVFHFALATKQPSMTAPALAGKIKNLKSRQNVEDFVEETLAMVRSQVAAVVGNVGFVIPGAIIFEYLFRFVMGRSVIKPEYASYVMESHNPIESFTVLFAICTGVLLWGSSISAGWLENWFVYRQLPQAISQNRFITRTFGTEKATKLADWLTYNVAGLGGNIGIGFLLAVFPVFGKFFGVPLDVRHVTLSSGSVTFAAMSYSQLGVIDWYLFGMAALGIIIIGLCNFGVSFTLAILVAIRARGVSQKWFWYLMRAVSQRFLKRPQDFFIPPRQSKAQSPTQVNS